MFFTDKFATIISIIEKNINNNEQQSSGVKEIAEEIGEKVYCNASDVRRAFSFITNMNIPEYMTLRKIEIILSEKRNGKESLEKIATKYGYSEASSFHRDVKRKYNTTTTKIINGEADVNLMKPLTVDRLIKGDYMNTDIVNNMMSNNEISSEIEDILCVLEDKEIKKMISDKFNCASMYGITTGQVLRAYSASIEKGPEAMEKASRLMSENYPQRAADSFDEHEMDVLYLVINYELLPEEAEKIVKDVQRTETDIKKADHNYFEMAKSLYGEYGSFSEKISYQDNFNIIENIRDTFKCSGVQVEGEWNDKYCCDIISIIVKNCSKEDIEKRSEFFYDQIRWFIKIVIENHWSDYCEHFSLLSNTGSAKGFNYSDDKKVEKYHEIANASEMDVNTFMKYLGSIFTAEYFSKKFPILRHEELEDIVIDLMRQNGIDQNNKDFIRCFVFLFASLTFNSNRADIVSRSKSLVDYINVLAILFICIRSSYELYDKTTVIMSKRLLEALEQKGITTVKDIDGSYIYYLIDWQREHWNAPPFVHYDEPLSYGDYMKTKYVI